MKLMLSPPFKGEKSLCRQNRAVGRLDYGWRWRQEPDWWREVESRLVGLVSGEAFAAAFLRIKGVIPRCMRKKNLAFRLSGCESPGPSLQEAAEFDKVSPWAGV